MLALATWTHQSSIRMHEPMELKQKRFWCARCPTSFNTSLSLKSALDILGDIFGHVWTSLDYQIVAEGLACKSMIRRFQASMLIWLTFACCAAQSAVSNNIPISADFCTVFWMGVVALHSSFWGLLREDIGVAVEPILGLFLRVASHADRLGGQVQLQGLLKYVKIMRTADLDTSPLNLKHLRPCSSLVPRDSMSDLRSFKSKPSRTQLFLKLWKTQLQDLRLQLILAAYLAISATATAALRLRRQAPALLLGLGLIVVPRLPGITELWGHVWILKSSKIIEIPNLFHPRCPLYQCPTSFSWLALPLASGSYILWLWVGPWCWPAWAFKVTEPEWVDASSGLQSAYWLPSLLQLLCSTDYKPIQMLNVCYVFFPFQILLQSMNAEPGAWSSDLLWSPERVLAEPLSSGDLHRQLQHSNVPLEIPCNSLHEGV